MANALDSVSEYFRLAAQPDLQAYCAQFTDAAIVKDESREFHGVEQIRAWRANVTPVAYDVTDIATESDAAIAARVEISGDFPGSPVSLTFRFVFSPSGLIDQLAIRV